MLFVALYLIIKIIVVHGWCIFVSLTHTNTQFNALWHTFVHQVCTTCACTFLFRIDFLVFTWMGASISIEEWLFFNHSVCVIIEYFHVWTRAFNPSQNVFEGLAWKSPLLVQQNDTSYHIIQHKYKTFVSIRCCSLTNSVIQFLSYVTIFCRTTHNRRRPYPIYV